MHLVDKVLQHLLGHREVGDHAFLHRADGGDIGRRAAEHLFRLLADGRYRFRTSRSAVLADRDDRGFVEHDALVACIDQGVGGTQIDR